MFILAFYRRSRTAAATKFEFPVRKKLNFQQGKRPLTTQAGK
jgi:hypothetical protein